MGEGTSPCVYWGEGNLGDGPGLLLHPNPSTVNVYSECSKKTTERLTMCHPPCFMTCSQQPAGPWGFLS